MKLKWAEVPVKNRRADPKLIDLGPALFVFGDVASLMALVMPSALCSLRSVVNSLLNAFTHILCDMFTDSVLGIFGIQIVNLFLQ
jgi:hypothetical protein